ncbi:MAG: tetratricopeptide repeat protein [Bacteroidota bacterium]
MKKILFVLIFIQSSVFAQTLKDAMRLNDNEQYDAATAMYKQLITKEPGNGNIYYAFGENLLDAGDPDAAESMFNSGFTAEPGNAINSVGLAKVMLYKGDMLHAKAEIDKVIGASKSKNAILLMEAGEAYTQFKVKDLTSAQTYLETAVKIDSKNPDIYNALGDVYSELNNGTLAATNYNKALDIDKNYTKALLHKGQLYKRSTNYEGAAVEFQNALAIDQNFATAYRELGEVFYLQNKLEKAKENYKKYLDLSKNNNVARLKYASFLFYSKNCPEGLNELNLIPYDSTNLGIVRLTGYFNYDCGDSIKSLNAITRLFNMTAPDTGKRINLDYLYYGKILLRNGNDSLGSIYMWKSYYLDPSKTDLLREMAQMYTKAKQNCDAAKCYQELVNQGKNVTVTDYFNLGKSYYYCNDSIKADSAFAKVTELQPAYAYGHFWRARTNLRMDPNAMLGLANPHFEKFIELTLADTAATAKNRKDLVEAYGNIALSYYNQKNYEKASDYCKKVLEIDPENVNAKKILNNIKLIREAANKKKEDQ